MALHWRTDHKSLVTSIGEVNYRDIGAGAPVVFVHGVFMNGGLWDDVIFYLPPDLRTVRPDLPLGGHSCAAKADADLALPKLALLLLEIIDALDLSDVTLVANGYGGAICQHAVISRDMRVSRIARLVLTNGGLTGQFETSLVSGADDGALASLAAWLNTPNGRREFFEAIAASPIPDEQMHELLGGFLHSDAVRRDTRKVLLGLSPIQVPEIPSSFAGPVSIVWGLDDPASAIAEAEELARSFAAARVTGIKNYGLLVPLDHPETLASTLIDLLTRQSEKRRGQHE